MRRLVRFLGFVLLLFVLAAGAGYLYLRQSLPVVDGTVTIAGLTGPVDIIRDADAIPHIFATTKQDALFGLGYVHAQDRLWQMEFQRRIGFGRLSEVFGAATVPQDRFLRTVGFGRAARSAWAHLPEDARQQIEAYVNGVNAFIDTHHGRRLPPEFTLLRFEPEPFTGPDVLVWVKMMAWDLSGNYELEMMRYDIAGKVGDARMSELLPPYPADGLTIVPGGDDAGSHSPAPAPSSTSGETSNSRPGRRATARALARSVSGNPIVKDLLLGSGAIEAIGSNNWVVDGTLTASGKPMLANDPHLGAHVPSLWYLAHMTAGDFDVIGATLPGAPAVAIGRNRFIAWGETNVAADVQDLYLEHLDAEGTTAEFRGQQEPLRIVPETIVVKDADPVQLNVRITRHGPLISDAINANNAAFATGLESQAEPLEPMALRWTALDEQDETVVAFLRLNEARNWDDFTDAMRHFVTPSQNFVYADVEGNIGYLAPGLIPVRASGDGSRPAAGWTGEAEWSGWIPFGELPQLYNPPQHFIVTANNRPMGADYPHLIALEYPNPYRAERITELISRKQGLRPDDFRDIQADTLSTHARALLPLLLEHVRDDETTGPAIDRLRQWDFDAQGDSAAEAIYQAWFLRLAPVLVGDELGPLVLPGYESRFSYITRFVTGVLTAGASAWCDDVGTRETETCDEMVTKALRDGVVDLRERMGSDIGTWRWDAVHRAIFPHQGLDTIEPLRPLLSRSIPNGGDWSTVNVGTVAADALYEQHAVPGYRQIVDLSPANDSRFLDAVGQSGHFLSPHYDDFQSDWQAVVHRRMRMKRTEAEAGAIGHLQLRPQVDP
jgi:penicillin amidase